MNQAGVPERLTLTDVASLARVQRPVVSMWRARSVGSATPFPRPAGTDAGRELFDGLEVARWLALTGRGNNPDAIADVAAHARLPLPESGPDGPDGPRSGSNLDGLTALLTLSVLIGAPLTGLDAEELLDAADEQDPEDTFLYSEINDLGSRVTSMADFAGRLADSHYNAAEAFEALVSQPFRLGVRELSDTVLAPSAVALVSAIAAELAADLPGQPVVVDSTSGGSDILLGAVQAYGNRGPLGVRASGGSEPAARLVRRRLRAHGVTGIGAPRDGRTTESLVHVAQYPPPGNRSMSPTDILSAIETTSGAWDDSHRAVVIAPAQVLTDALRSRADAELRSDLLRTGRVRAVVRLPRGLRASRPREAQALWVLGPTFAEVGIADRWTMVADLGQDTLTESVVQDLVSDVVASMHDLAAVRAHAFRFARLVRTRSLLAARGALTAGGTTMPGTARPPGESAVQAERLVQSLGPATAGGPLIEQRVQAASEDAGPPSATLGHLMAAGHLRYLQGTRLDAATASFSAAGAALIGTEQVVDPEVPLRRITVLEFAARFPAGRLTRPGDIIFTTTPHPAARVDIDGGSVVVFPARALRIDSGDPGGLVPEVVAADIGARRPNEKEWRRWELRRVSDHQRSGLSAAIQRLNQEQDTLRERLRHVEQLSRLIVDGVAGGSLTLTDPTSPAPPTHAIPSEGTA